MIQKIGRVWKTKKEGTDVILSGEIFKALRIGIIKAKDKETKKVVEGTYDIILFTEDKPQ